MGSTPNNIPINTNEVPTSVSTPTNSGGSGSSGTLVPLPQFSGNSITGWAEQIQSWAQQNTGLAVLFGVGLIILAYDAFDKQGSKRHEHREH